MTEIKPLKSNNNDVSDAVLLLRKNATTIIGIIADVHKRHVIYTYDAYRL